MGIYFFRGTGRDLKWFYYAQAQVFLDEYASCYHYVFFIGDENEKLYKIVGKNEVPKDLFALSEKMYHSNYPPNSDPQVCIFISKMIHY